MQHYGWIFFALVVLGPLLGALMLERLGLGRSVSVAGVAALCLGAVAAVLHGTHMAAGNASFGGPADQIGVATGLVRQLAGWRAPPPSPIAARQEAEAALAGERAMLQRSAQELSVLREQLASLGAERQKSVDHLAKAKTDLEGERAANAKIRQELGAVRGHLASLEKSSARSEGAPPSQLQADLDGERLAHTRTRNQVQGLRDQVANLEAANRTAAGADIPPRLDNERAAHEKSRVALKAAEQQKAALEADAKRLDGELRKALAEIEAARAEAGRRQTRLSEVEGQVQQLGAELRRAREAAQPLAVTPVPFSAPPPAASPAVAQLPSAPPPSAAPGSPLRVRLDAGLTTASFNLQLLPASQLVEGQPGSYYRVACRDAAGGKRLVFDPGGYNITGGNTKIDPCFKALNSAVLSAVPPGTQKVVYVQGHASKQGFVRPQPLVAGDAHLKALAYLVRSADGQQFAPKSQTQTVTTTFLNKHLPVLRAGSVSDWVETSTKGAFAPLLLDGEFKETSDEASRSFDFIVYVKW